MLWGLLVALIVGLLAMLMWLAARYESSQVQDLLDRDAAEAVSFARAYEDSVATVKRPQYGGLAVRGDVSPLRAAIPAASR